MSLFFEDNSTLKVSLDALPEKNTNDEIVRMVTTLKNDMMENSAEEFSNIGSKIMFYGNRHREFCLSYPLMFRSFVRGTFTDEMLHKFLETRKRLDTGELTKETAQNHLVDLGVHVLKNKHTPS
jgi:hypothetical protein